MGLRISNLIDCSSCANYDKEDNICGCETTLVRNEFRRFGVRAANTCAEFINIRTTNTSIIPNDKALEFMLAGKSEFVVVSGKTNAKIRYKLDRKNSYKPYNNISEEKDKTSDNQSENNNLIYWLSTDNNGMLIYAGVIYFDNNSSSKQFKFSKGARGNLTVEDIGVKSILFILNHLYNKKYTINIKVYHVGKCGKCGKKLTDPKSIITGLGPVCAKESKIPR